MYNDETPMRIVAWNVNHRTFAKPIPSAMADALLSLGPDVIVLTEYVRREEFPGHGFLCEGLRNVGFSHFQLSAETAAHYDGKKSRRRSNQVFIASREPLDNGTRLIPEPAPF